VGDFSVERYSGDAPHFSEPVLPKNPSAKLACEPCGSEDAALVHRTGGGSIIGSWSEVEVRCRACGRYSAKIEEYDS
jgi:ribosomal protein S27E